MTIFTHDAEREVLCEMNVTPLVDVMLVLLVVFIVTAPLLTNVIPLKLPHTDAVAPPDQKKPMVVSVAHDGNYFIDRRGVTLADMSRVIAQKQRQNARLGVELRADQGVEYRYVAKAMATIQRAGVTRLAVVTNAGT